MVGLVKLARLDWRAGVLTYDAHVYVIVIYRVQPWVKKYAHLGVHLGSLVYAAKHEIVHSVVVWPRVKRKLKMVSTHSTVIKNDCDVDTETETSKAAGISLGLTVIFIIVTVLIIITAVAVYIR